ncbi:Pimeloyl-ACP methyl ester carboxylesterase [Cognatiyoonia koreensis]|uniref:Pimeloyl-ACP methyl ester carboxylesterase n=1 Tax=Cognatiyoonia koreensis TaxID=364200 RepID=A0A1I0RFU0_9RHOB|nr:alpha/beta hydrolase [Cognatiyoonia koreensis]SEW39648.1 Pimeloyl-ACP methyl ester carboxylesterase [Cognatiyoonia koreensis]
MGIVWILIGIVAALVILSIMLERQRHPIGKAERKGAPGKFAELSQGITYYRWHGPVRGPVLVAIHGLTTPSIVFDVIAGGLGAMGYRVLTYDLYGRGLSDAPGGEQNRDFLLQQLDDLLEHQNLNEDLTLLGYSMGGSIATAFTETQSHRVKRLILLATAGADMNESGFSRFCRRYPVIGDWVHNLIGAARMRRAISAEAEASEVDGVKRAQRDQLGRRGFLPAVLSSRRGMLAETQKEAHQTIGRADVPVIAIWGEADDVIPISALGTIAQWNRNARQETIPGAGHGMPYTHATAVIEKLRAILIEVD